MEREVVQPVALRVEPGAEASRSESRFLPSAALAYRIGDAWTLFTRYQQGFRPGGIAVRQSGKVNRGSHARHSGIWADLHASARRSAPPARPAGIARAYGLSRLWAISGPTPDRA